MTTNSDVHTVPHPATYDNRADANDAPAAEDLLAYSRGELSPEREEQMRELLSRHPDLARALTVPFPTEGARPGEADYLSDEEFAAHWASMQTRMKQDERTAGRILPFRRVSAAAAATLVAVLGGLLVHAEWRARNVANELAQPRLAPEGQMLSPDEQRLQPDGQRGGPSGIVTVGTKGDSYLLVAPLINAGDFARYRLEIVNLDTASSQALWKSVPIARRDDNSFAVIVPRRFLDAGRYQLLLYGIGSNGDERLAGYSFRVLAATAGD